MSDSKFTEAKLEEAIIELLCEEGYPHVLGEAIEREPGEVLRWERNPHLNPLPVGEDWVESWETRLECQKKWGIFSDRNRRNL